MLTGSRMLPRTISRWSPLLSRCYLQLPSQKGVQSAVETRGLVLRNCFTISSKRKPKAKLRQTESPCMLCEASLHMAEVCCNSMSAPGHFLLIHRHCRSVKVGQNCIRLLEKC